MRYCYIGVSIPRPPPPPNSAATTDGVPSRKGCVVNFKGPPPFLLTQPHPFSRLLWVTLSSLNTHTHIQQGERRFHNWLPFAPAMYEAYRGTQDTATPSTATADSSHYSDASHGQQWTPASAGGGGGGELWVVDHQLATAGPPHSSHFSGYESYDYPGSEYYGYNNDDGNGGGVGGGGDQQVAANRVASWSAEANQQWYYGGAESYDGAAHYRQPGPSGGSDQGWAKSWSAESNQQWGAGGYGDGAVTASDYYPAWTPETPDTPGDGTTTGHGFGYGGGGGGADGGEEWAAAAAETSQDWSSSTPESAKYYGYDSTGGVALGATDRAAMAGGAQAWSEVAAATGWDTGWATPETAEAPTTANGSDGLSSAPNAFAGDGGGVSDVSFTGGGNTAATPPSGGSSGRPWSVNEFGQRVSGDWVEYYDESAQAAYYYNTISGEVRKRINFTNKQIPFISIIVAAAVIVVVFVAVILSIVQSRSRDEREIFRGGT